MGYLFDTNIFVRLANQSDSQRQIVLDALRILRTRNEDLCYVPQVLCEFWNICTRPVSARGGLGLSLSQTERKARLTGKHFHLLADNPAIHQEWLRLVVSHSVMGTQVYDARLAASMQIHGIQNLLTFNVGDFKRFTTVTAIHPREIR